MNRLLATALLFHAAAALGQEEPPRIGRIEIVVNEIFADDKEEEGGLVWAYRAANRLHVKTREELVRQELLFASGDPLEPELLEQTERNLRALAFLRDAKIETAPAEDGTVNVRVVTHDAWSTVPELKLAKVGNELTWAVGASERNLLGWGKHFEVTRRSDIDRESTFFYYGDPRLGGTRFATGVAYSDSRDGRRVEAAVYRPFFSLDTKWAFGLRLEALDRIQPLYAAGARTDELHHVRNRAEIELARMFLRADRGALRAHVAYRKLRDDGDGGLRSFGIVQIGLSFVEHRFLKLTHVNRFERTEDFNLGHQAHVFLGLARPALGGEDRALFLVVQEQKGFRLGEQQFVLGRVSWQARRRHGAFENRLATVRLDYVNKMATRHLLLGSAELRHGRRLDPEVQLSVGAQNGLRGYPVHQWTGDRSLLVALEKRFFIADDVARLASFGLATYLETGYAWPAGERLALEDFRSDLGFGLLVGRNRISTRQPAIRFDLAYALQPLAGRGRWLFSAGSAVGF